MKHNHLKLSALLAMALIVILALVGCSSPTAEESAQAPAPTEAPAEEPTMAPTEVPTEAPTMAPKHSHTPDSAEASDKIDPVVFRQTMRQLWEDHAFWTRSYIVSAVADLPDTQLTAERLLQNQADIGNAIAGFYGEEAGAALTELLREHILTAAELVGAAKAGDQDAVAKAGEAWYANADEISVFLASANPAWPEDALKEMMKMHLDQTLAEATAQLSGDYEASVAGYDEIVTHLQMMADTLSAGIITQFPDRFSEASLSQDGEGLHAAMRDLWVDHVAWTRLYIVSAVADLPDTQVTAGRLLQNQADIGNAVADFYGEEAGAALTELLRGHILTAADLVAAAKSGDQDAVAKASEAWYVNANEISAFLATANPAWPEDTLMEMMKMHLDQTLVEATAQLTGDYSAGIASYDEIVTHIHAMADALSSGIIAQFPDRFDPAS